MVAGLINDIPSCKELVGRIMAEAEGTYSGDVSRNWPRHRPRQGPLCVDGVNPINRSEERL